MKAKLPIQILAFLVLVSTSLLSTSCEREIKRKKITGTYRLTEYTVNGEDSLSVFQDYYADSKCSELIFRFYGKEDLGDTFQRVDCEGNDERGFLPGNWDFANGFENIVINFPHPIVSDTLPDGSPLSRYWDFIKLKYKKMELEGWHDGDLHRIVLSEKY